MKTKLLFIIAFFLIGLSMQAQDEEKSDETVQQDDQDRASQAMDATATQWSFQLAYQSMPDYQTGKLSDGITDRPLGLDNYLQLRVVAPVPLKSMTILPRVTLRHYEDLKNKKSGIGNTEIFALIIPNATNWGTGRAGIGPLVTLPGNKDVAKDEWGYGFSAAIVNNSGQWFYGLLFTQSWRSVDPNALQPIPLIASEDNSSSNINPLGIAPFLAYRFSTTGMYVQTADIVALYDWNTKGFYLPLGARFGKVWVLEKASWNAYVEYKTSAIYEDWQGPAVKNSFRINLSYTMPVGKK